MPVLATIGMALLAGLGFVGYKLGMVLYRKIQELDMACQLVHHYSPAKPGVLFTLVTATGSLIFLGMALPSMVLANIPAAVVWLAIFTFCIAMVYSTMKTLIENSSSEVAWALFSNCFLLALLFILTFVGVVGFIALMVFKRDALQTERRQEFDRLRIDIANSAMNGPF